MFVSSALKDTGSVALCDKGACSFTKSASLAINSFDYQPSNSMQSIWDEESVKSPEKEEREVKITEELRQSTQDLPVDAEEVNW